MQFPISPPCLPHTVHRINRTAQVCTMQNALFDDWIAYRDSLLKSGYALWEERRSGIRAGCKQEVVL